MKIALVGYGKMGKMVEALAGDDVQIAAVFDMDPPFRADDATRIRLEGVDALIDFSVPSAVVAHVKAAAELGLPIVVGTTGWREHLPALTEVVQQAGTALVWAPNFSLGVNLFYRVVDRAAALFAQFDAYDPFLHEAHHRFKLDAPSGTALALKDQVAQYYPADKKLDVSSTRAGHIPGTHVVGFDSAADTVELRHTARSREGFAQGALVAAKWIVGKQGVFEFGAVLDDLLTNYR